jgi:DNA-binding NtrC family response regulator
MILELYKECLEDIGHTLFTAETPYQALQICKNQDIQLALLDYNLPQMTGTELGHLLYKSNNELDIVFISGNMDIHEIVSKVNYPVCNVFLKPVDLSLVVDNVISILGEGCVSRQPRVEHVQRANHLVKFVKSITDTSNIIPQTSASIIY